MSNWWPRGKVTYTVEELRYYRKYTSLQDIPSFRSDPIGYVNSIPTQNDPST